MSYDVPLRTKRFKVIVKTSSACGIYFVCPCCHFEMLKADKHMFPRFSECPNCHADLTFPDPRETHEIHRRFANIYVP